MPLKVKVTGSLQPQLDYLKDIKTWLSLNFLTLNESQTEVRVFGPPGLLDVDTLGPLSSYVHSPVKILGMCFNDAFKLDKQISSVIKSSFFQLRLISKVKACLPFKDLDRLTDSNINTSDWTCEHTSIFLHCSLKLKL